MSKYAEIIARLEKATGPDRELDGAIWLLLIPEAKDQCWSVKGMKYAGRVHTRSEKAAHIKWASEYRSPPYTASIDAAVALVERVLPEFRWIVYSDGSAAVHQGNGYFQEAATPAIALLLALFHALEAKEADHG